MQGRSPDTSGIPQNGSGPVSIPLKKGASSDKTVLSGVDWSLGEQLFDPRKNVGRSHVACLLGFSGTYARCT